MCGGFDDGSWYAATMGEFVAMIVDGGDPAVRFRVIEDSEPDDSGKFCRVIEVVLLPQGHVLDEIEGCKNIHKTLTAMIKGGIVS